MENPAQPSDLTKRGYSGTVDETVQRTWLDVSFRALRRELRRINFDLEKAVEAEEVDAEDVVDVVAAAALRVLRNPDGVKQESGGIEDYTESRTLGDSTEDVFFTAAELRRLTPAPTGAAVADGWAGSVKYL